MAELQGYNTEIAISGAAATFVGEATTMSGTNTKYQITFPGKQVLDRLETIHVLIKGTNDAAEAGTSTTNIKMTAHGLYAGDVIINTSRSSALREVLVRVDADNITVAAVTSQTTGDTIEVYKQAAANTYTLDRLSGTVTFTTATARTVLMSGLYLPMTVAAYANQASIAYACDFKEVNTFGTAYKKREPTLKYASGSLSQFDLTDTTYAVALASGLPIVIDYRPITTDGPNRFWALLDKSEVQSAIDGIQNQVVTWTSTDAWLRLSV